MVGTAQTRLCLPYEIVLRHCERSEAIQMSHNAAPGLLRFARMTNSYFVSSANAPFQSSGGGVC
jgi:hypothetical protein